MTENNVVVNIKSDGPNGMNAANGDDYENQSFETPENEEAAAH